MDQPGRTVLYDRHVALGARLVDFAGWEMPVQYPTGILAEHLATRAKAGLFDVSHMGRFAFRGRDAEAFLEHALTCDVAGLPVGRACYTFLADEDGGAIDDAFLYRFIDNEYLLVVNAANAAKDWAHLEALAAAGLPGSSLDDLERYDRSDELAMISLQGPAAAELLAGLADGGALPPDGRNSLGAASLGGRVTYLARTGYTGEPICFELFCPAAAAGELWDTLVDAGAAPVGLGARDTLRLEAALPLYGHELGTDADGKAIPIFAIPQARFGVCLTESKDKFVGRRALEEQAREGTPRHVRPLALLGKGVARAGADVLAGGAVAGTITSGTMVPYFTAGGDGETAAHANRAIALALIDGKIEPPTDVEVDIRGRRVPARIVQRHMRVVDGTRTEAVLIGER